MPEINLLPDDLRQKEKKELESISKKSKVFEVAMSSPGKEKPDQPLKTSRPSLMSRLFSRQSSKPSFSDNQQEDVQPSSSLDSSSRTEKKVFKESFNKGMPSASESSVDANAGANVTSISGGKSYAIKDSPGETQSDAGEDLPLADSGKQKFRLFSRQQKAVTEDVFADKDANFKKDKRKKHGDDESVLELNLIPEELSKYPELEFPKKVFRSGLSIFLAILFVVGAYLGITWYQLNINSKIEGLEKTIADIKEDIAQQEAIRNSAEDLQKRLTAIEGLLGKHVYWTQFFEQLEKNTLPQVYYLSFAMTGTEGLILSAITDSYSSVAEQIVTFEQADDFIKDVKVSGASAEFNQEEGTLIGVDFNVELDFQPGVFLKNNSN